MIFFLLSNDEKKEKIEMINVISILSALRKRKYSYLLGIKLLGKSNSA